MRLFCCKPMYLLGTDRQGRASQPADWHGPVCENAQNLSPVRKTGEGLRRLAAAAHHGEGPPSPSPRNAHIPMDMRKTGKRMWDAAADCRLLPPACAARFGEGLAGPSPRNAHIHVGMRETGVRLHQLPPIHSLHPSHATACSH